MKKLNIVLSGIMAVSLSSFAHNSMTEANGAASGSQKEADLAKLPQSGEGVKIVSEDEMPNVPKTKESLLAFANEKKLGYVVRKSHDAIQLLEMGKHKFQQKDDVKFYNIKNNYDTHLKKTAALIPLAFDFSPLSFIDPQNSIGFAPAMTYKKGWTGIVEFFNYPSIGTCSYSKTSVPLNGSAIRLSKSRISYYINQKPAVAINEGRKEEGFSYIVNWYDNAFFHRLACASLDYSADASKRVVELAQLIDKEN